MSGTHLGSLVALRAALAGEPYVRSEVDPAVDGEAWAVPDEGAAAWWLLLRDRVHLVSVGLPEAVAPLVQQAWAGAVAAVGEPTRVTVPRGTPGLLPRPMRPVGDVHDWDWMWTADAPPPQAGEELVAWLPESDAGEIVALLDAASPHHSASPGDPEVVRWCGIREVGGRHLLAVAAHTCRVPGVPHLASIAVHPQLRSHGLGGAITAWVTRELLAEGAREVTLGMYAWNDPARRVYRRLGYVDDHPFTSGLTTAAAAEGLPAVPARAGAPAGGPAEEPRASSACGC